MNDFFSRRSGWLALSTLLLAFPVGCGSPSASKKAGSSKASVSGVATTQHADSAPAPLAASGGVAIPTVRTAATDGVTVKGRVILEGAAPKRSAINMSKDAACIKIHGDKPVLSEELIVGEGGAVKNAFVYVRRGAPKIDYPVPEKVVELDQKGCMYHPRVQGMMAGQKLKVLNSDPVTHNVRSFPVRNRAFNFGQPADSGPRERVFETAEPQIEIQCDIHPWMHAYLFVMDHPFFAVSDEAGNWSIEGLPPGQFSLAIWHEELGKQQQDVKVGDQSLEGIHFKFKP